MLILSMKKNESIMIGNIRVLVVKLSKSRIWLGVDAPKDVTVHRQEVHDAIQSTIRRDPHLLSESPKGPMP